MKSDSQTRKKAALMSAFLCPGLGQLSVGRKKRGYVFIFSIVGVLLVLMYKTYAIVQAAITPELIMEFSPIKFLNVFMMIRARVYSESVYLLILFLMIWAASIIDIFIGRIEND